MAIQGNATGGPQQSTISNALTRLKLTPLSQVPAPVASGLFALTVDLPRTPVDPHELFVLLVTE